MERHDVEATSNHVAACEPSSLREKGTVGDRHLQRGGDKEDDDDDKVEVLDKESDIEVTDKKSKVEVLAKESKGAQRVCQRSHQREG